MLGLFGFLHVFTVRLAQRRPKRRRKRQSSWPSRRRRRPASVTGGVVVVAVVAVVVVTAGFAAAVAFDVASIPALQELRGLNAWERHWRNQHKKAAAKVGRSNTGRGWLPQPLCITIQAAKLRQPHARTATVPVPTSDRRGFHECACFFLGSVFPWQALQRVVVSSLNSA
jgi:hypothetical protein